MKYKHIIWDYNGTILDDAQFVLDIINLMLEKRNLPASTMKFYRDVFGFPVIECYQAVGFDVEEHSFSELADEFTEEYAKLFPTCKLREGVVDFIKHLDKQGYKQSILTAGQEKGIKQEIKDFGLDNYILEITGLHNNKAESKVHLAQHHLDKIKVDPKDILFIGDTTHDNLVAKEIGCDCVLLAGGHQSVERLKAVNKKVAKTPSEIKKYLD